MRSYGTFVPNWTVSLNYYFSSTSLSKNFELFCTFYSFGSSLHVKFQENIRDMFLYGAFRKKQAICNFLVGETLVYELENFIFSFAEPNMLQVLLVDCSLWHHWLRWKISSGYKDANNEKDKADHSNPDLNAALPGEVGDLCQLKQDKNTSDEDAEAQSDTLHKYS